MLVGLPGSLGCRVGGLAGSLGCRVAGIFGLAPGFLGWRRGRALQVFTLRVSDSPESVMQERKAYARMSVSGESVIQGIGKCAWMSISPESDMRGVGRYWRTKNSGNAGSLGNATSRTPVAGARLVRYLFWYVAPCMRLHAVKTILAAIRCFVSLPMSACRRQPSMAMRCLDSTCCCACGFGSSRHSVPSL